MSDARNDAVDVLHHYIALTMRKVGLTPDSDTRAEIEQCVDHIIDAATVEAIRQIDGRMTALEQRGATSENWE